MPCTSLFPYVRCLGFTCHFALLSVSKDVIELIGVVEECFPNATFRVRITSEQAEGHILLCHLAGRMRVNRVRILPGDRVKLEMTPYDLGKGRIVYRFSPVSTHSPAPKLDAAGAVTDKATDGQKLPSANPPTTP
ncbi:translation initiation factor IF-1 [Candidatus Peregrinibacteria bacterium]|nr:translation initiation factor IF-1 [Candidatus Peregrinibacteria bacterium]